MEFSWDERKRDWVLAERGIDFALVAFTMFDGRPLLTVPTPRADEDRFLSIGRIGGKVLCRYMDVSGRDDKNHNCEESKR